MSHSTSAVFHRASPRCGFGLFALLFLVAVSAACSVLATPHAPPSGAAAATGSVVHDIDGDTIDVRIDGHVERLRLLGIDTPETKDPRKPVQCFGKEASAHTAQLLPPRTNVTLVRDVEARDKYGRLLVYVYRLPDKLFVNRELVAHGYASLLTYPPNVAHEAELRHAMEAARAQGLGLWGTCGGPGKAVDSGS